jgi:hypothetical protein
MARTTPPTDPSPSESPEPLVTPEPDEPTDTPNLSTRAYDAGEYIAQALAVARATEKSLSDSLELFDTKARLRAIAHLLEHALDEANDLTEDLTLRESDR